MRRLVLLVALSALTLSVQTALAPQAWTAPVEAGGVRLTQIKLPGSFDAQQVVVTAGTVWVLGSTGPNTFTNCALEEITPGRRVASTRYPLPECGSYVAAGEGRVFLVAETTSPSSNVRAYHIDVFDPATHLTQVQSPVVLSNVGSAIAHMDFTYGEGSLWLYGYSYPSSQPTVVRISPATGAVEGSITAVPGIGGIFPAVAVDQAGTFLGGGPGGPPGVEWVRPGAASGTTAYGGPAAQSSSVLWLSAVGDRVWAGVAVYAKGKAPSNVAVTTDVVALRPDGTVALIARAEPTPDVPLVATAGGSDLWDIASGSSCARPLRLVEIDPSSGRMRRSALLGSAPDGCDVGGQGTALLAALGRDVFALVPSAATGTAAAAGGSVLYRAAT